MRVVSLVPSATETLVALGTRPVACTRFCHQEGIPTVGGTKDPDVAAIVDRAPDLVVVNDEENRREDADALRAAGVVLHSCSPRTVADVGPAVQALAEAVHRSPPPAFRSPRWDEWLRRSRREGRGRAVTLVWRRPWMVLSPDTYGASLLEHAGLETPVLGAGRYPAVDAATVGDAAVDLVLLPSEPYPFRSRHVDIVRAELGGLVDVRLVDGEDLFWWGSRTPDALDRLAAALT